MRPSAQPTQAPATPYDPINGGTPSANGVYAVKIDNLAPARPQIGISQADVVVVEEVESRLTRLVGIFHSRHPTKVGPVRSARNTDLELLPLFGRPGLVYSGANRKVQANVQRSPHLVPLERNDRDRSRRAPHNVVVDLARLAKQSKVGAVPTTIGWTFAANDPLWAQAPASATLTVRIGQDTFTFTRKDARYQVAAGKDVYDDAGTGKPLAVDTVVVLSVRNRRDDDTTSSISIVSETVGTGRVAITREGRTRTGTWRRDKVTSPMTFTDGAGQPISLRPGQTWLMLQGS